MLGRILGKDALDVSARLALAIAAIHTARLFHFALTHASFQAHGEDAMGFWLAKNLPFWSFLFTRIDVHYVPLHRLSSLLVYGLAPMNFALAASFLLTFHVLGCFFLYAAISRIRSGPLNLFLVAWYAMSPYLASQFFWWTAGLHRLPYILFSNAAVYFYLVHRSERTRSTFAAVVACQLLALGFFPKGVLLPALLFGIEFALEYAERSESGRASSIPSTRRRVKPLLMTISAVSLAYFLAWRAAAPSSIRELNLNPVFLAKYMRWSWTLFGLGTAGYLHRDLPSVGFWVGASWVLVVTYSLARGRASVVAWTCCVALVTLSAYTGTSESRAQVFGPHAALFADRYYFELTPIFVFFCAIVARGIHPAARERALFRRPFAQWCRAVAAASIALWLASNGYQSATSLFASRYSDSSYAKAVLENLRHDLRDVRRDRDGSFPLVDGNIRDDTVLPVEHPRKKSELLELMGERPRVVLPTPGAYWMTDRGRLFRL